MSVTLTEIINGTYTPSTKEETNSLPTQPCEKPLEFTKLIPKEEMPSSGYLIWCEWSKQMWYAPTLECLNKSFIYRDDLVILVVYNSGVYEWFEEKMKSKQGLCPSRKCYILDRPKLGMYEVFYESDYPTKEYGCSTPKGCKVHAFANRFERDAAIVELDKAYDRNSPTAITENNLGDREAIIVMSSDVGVYSYVYYDSYGMRTTSNTFIPTDIKNALFASASKCAWDALMHCTHTKRDKITFYYDDESLLIAASDKALANIEEVRLLQKLIASMDHHAYEVEFLPIGEDLKPLYNSCRKNCRDALELQAYNIK